MLGRIFVWALVWALAVCPVEAQSPQVRATVLFGQKTSVAAAGGCSQATTFLAAASGTTHGTAYTTLICNLVTQGVFAKLDGLYIFATDTHTIADINLIQPGTFNITENGPPSFAANQGFTGSSSTNPFLDTGFTPGSSSGHYAQNSAMVGFWTRTATTDPSNGNVSGTLMNGAANTADVSNAFFATTTSETTINSAFGTPSITATGTGLGYVAGNRSASNAVQLYLQGSSAATNTTASAALTGAASIFFLSRDNGGGANQSASEQQAASFYGGSLTAGDHANLCHEIGAYLFSIGSIGSNPC